MACVGRREACLLLDIAEGLGGPSAGLRVRIQSPGKAVCFIGLRCCYCCHRVDSEAEGIKCSCYIEFIPELMLRPHRIAHLCLAIGCPLVEIILMCNGALNGIIVITSLM